jgi:hypothetical protein
VKAAWAVLALAAAGCVSYPPEDRRPLVTTDEVLLMQAAGVDESTLLARVRAGRLSAPVTADEIIRLKQGNVPDSVIKSLAEAAPPPVRVVERRVYVGDAWYPYGAYGYWGGYWGPRYYGYYGYPRYYYRGHPRYYHAPRY